MRRKRREENASEAILLKPDGTCVLVTAENVAKVRRSNPSEYASYNLFCPGKNRSGDVCTCRLTLCSWQEFNTPQPYFAHREDDGTEHIEGCDQAAGIRNIKYVKKTKESMENLNLGKMLDKMIAGEPLEPKPKGTDNPGGEPGGEVNTKGGHPKTTVDYVPEYVPVSNATDLYELCISASNNPDILKTEEGWSSKGILINYDSVDLYRREERPYRFRGPKLIVASAEGISPSLAEKISSNVAGNTYVLVDPYKTDNPEDRTIYYVLSFEGSDKLFERYMERIYKIREKEGLGLIFGRVEKLENDSGVLVCKVTIADGKCRQIKELRNSYEDERRLR